MTIRERVMEIVGLTSQEVMPPMPIEDVHLVRYFREKKEAEVHARGRTAHLYDVYSVHAFDPDEVWTWDERTEYRYLHFGGKTRGVLFGTLVIEHMG